MRHPLRNTLSVLAATVLTALAVFGAVQLGGSVTGADSSTVEVASAQSTVTGTSTDTSTGTLTCPRTGCTASTCHATQGGGRGGGW